MSITSQLVNSYRNNLMVAVGMTFTGLDNIGSEDRNIVTRSLKKGAVIYGARQAIKKVTEGKSDIEDMDIVLAVDEIAFNGLAVGAIDLTGVGKMLAENVNVGNGMINNVIIDTVVLSGMQVAGDNLYGSKAFLPIRHAGNWLKGMI